MLLAINLKNFAIIENLSITFTPGLNIITGETGAGKSIILDALNLILGDKASSDFIKSGHEEAHIEAIFDIEKDLSMKKKLQSLGFGDNVEELLIKRVISRKGRGRVLINGNMLTFSMLHKVADGLVDIFSQHEHQSLLRENIHLQILDEYAGTNSLLHRYSEDFNCHVYAKKELEELLMERKSLTEKDELLRFQCSEIGSMNIREDEDKNLEQERTILSHFEWLSNIVNESYKHLYEGEGSVVDILNDISSQIQQAAKIDNAFKDISKNLECAVAEIQDAAFSIRDYKDQIEFEPDRLDFIETRLNEINKLKRKYGSTIKEILDYRKKIEDELSTLNFYDKREHGLNIKMSELMSRIKDAADELSKRRKSAAKRFIAEIQNELGQVGIKGGSFGVKFETTEISHTGKDKITFLFSANPDEIQRPLSKIASGGELSRIMLVLNEILTRVEGDSIIIFDEADAGIGGAVAETVGRKIKDLSSANQVICITHLPQVAKFANTHFRVTKTIQDNKTNVTVKELNEQEKLNELARMLGGIKITEKTIEAAREMMNQ